MVLDINYDVSKERIRDFLSNYYLEDEDGSKTFPYTEQIENIAQRAQVSFYIEQDHVYEHDPELYEWINGNTQRYRNLFYEVIDSLISEILGDNEPPVRDALDAFIFQRLYADRKQKQIDGEMVEKEDLRKMYPPELMRRYELYFKTRDVIKPMSVRELHAQYVGKLVSVSGVVIRCTEVKPLASVITYSCDSCGSETYQQVTGTSYTPAFSCPSKECLESKANGRLLMQVRGSKFVKFQEIRVQELSSQVPVGSIPTAMTVYLTGENTRKVLPGDTVSISGVSMPLLRSGYRETAGGLIMDAYLDAHYVDNSRNEEDDLADMKMTDEETELFSKDDLYEHLAYSIAPEIYGHLDVKKSLLLALVGGVDKNANGMRIRGALNIILMGDPGVAKSQLLGYVDRLAFRSQYTTGRGSSGVGLTAAVIKDPVTGEMALEGGALVLADRGVCCIDEFDKMMDGDRTAIHEVMEQQTISIAKAGIMTSLNARVTIIAAANPAFGRYNPKRTIEENIQLPAALLSRFDLLWLIQDVPNRDADKRIAEHITYLHRKGEQPLVNFKAIEMKSIRKYVALCKRKQPIIPEPLKEKLVDEYVKIRKQALNQRNSLFTSPRILLGAIRLATARARLRLADVVSVDDVNEALRLMRASKESLQTNSVIKEKPRNPMDVAFDIIRDLLIENNRQPILIDDVFNKCNQRGLDDDIVNNCISHYENLGTLQRDSKQKYLQSVLN